MCLFYDSDSVSDHAYLIYLRSMDDARALVGYIDVATGCAMLDSSSAMVMTQSQPTATCTGTS